MDYGTAGIVLVALSVAFTITWKLKGSGLEF